MALGLQPPQRRVDGLGAVEGGAVQRRVGLGGEDQSPGAGRAGRGAVRADRQVPGHGLGERARVLGRAQAELGRLADQIAEMRRDILHHLKVVGESLNRAGKSPVGDPEILRGPGHDATCVCFLFGR